VGSNPTRPSSGPTQPTHIDASAAQLLANALAWFVLARPLPCQPSRLRLGWVWHERQTPVVVGSQYHNTERPLRHQRGSL